MWSWEGEYTHTFEPGCIHGPRCVFSDSVNVLLSLYVKCRAAYHFAQICWLGFDCVGHSYLEIAVLSIPLHAVTMMDFPTPIPVSDIQVALRNNMHLLSYTISFPSRPSLRKSSIIKESFSL